MPPHPRPTGPVSTTPPFALVPAAYVLLLRPHEHAARPALGTGPNWSGATSDIPSRMSNSASTEVLLQLRRNTGFMDDHWAAGIAGHVEPGEPVTATAVREGAEELDIILEPGDLAPLTAIHRSNAVGGPALEQRVDFFFTLTRWQGTPTIREPAKCGGLEWFALDALPDPIPPHEFAALRLLTAALDTGRPAPAITTFGFAQH
ncbi:NUDIX domain-containing protein [Actinomyces sp.]|uniref:NUDIX domain-containing protein n=1 Tax=Actinomyces sp. TaxID=29317 RepID=UPI0026DA7E62|nr:NUDIX domain-containing protein [Actinomyces sp.]MDO4901598.1 NUDIX domain-containing protein [Actinomyces sp.]